MLRAAVIVLLCSGCDIVLGLQPKPDAAPDASPPPERWRSVDGGSSHTCGIRIDRSLWCWGRSDAGQLGRGPTAGELEHAEPAQVGTAMDWESLSVGVETSCAIKTDQSLWCWGQNEYGQLGDGTMARRELPVRVPGAWRSVSTSRNHTCAIDDGEGLWCWGRNAQGQLGIGTKTASLVPTLVAGGGAWRIVRAGDVSSCGTRTDGTLWCWGSNAHGRLGLGDSSLLEQTTPQQVGTDAWTALALVNDFACAIRDTGALRCWGFNGSGQHGDRTTDSHASPNPVEDDQITDWKAVEVGISHTCALHGNGELACWGSNAHGQLASDLARTSRPIPTPVEGGAAPWASIGLGARHTCAIDIAGQLWCAGSAADGALGTGEGSRREPTLIDGSWARPTAGENAMCALVRGTQTLGCWGSNVNGLLGNGTQIDRQTPSAQMTQPYVAADLGDHGCAINPAGLRWCWGPNDQGQLGNGTTTNTAIPTQVGAATWSRISSSRSTSCGITPTQALFCWGRNAERQTGQPASAGPNPNAPVLVASPVTGVWKDVSTGNDFTCGLKTDNKPYCWGHNGHGQLGNGGGATTHVPQTVLTGQSFDSIVVGSRHACALTSAGLAWCWGSNLYGQLGDGSVTTRSSPVSLIGTWRMLALGEEHSCGIRTDNKIACWGRNHHGQVGDGTTLDRIDPTAVSSDTDWESVTAGLRHTCATKTDGRTYCWGANHGGGLGDGTAWRSALVLVTR